MQSLLEACQNLSSTKWGAEACKCIGASRSVAKHTQPLYLHAWTAQCRNWCLTFLFFLLLHCAFAERLPPRCQVTFRGHGLVRADWGWLGLAVAHARRVGLVLRRGRHGGRAAERRSSSRTGYRGLRAIAGCCGVAAAWARRVGLQAAQERGHFVTSQRSERKNRRPARRRGAAGGLGRRARSRTRLQLAAQRELRGARGLDVQSAGAGAVHYGLANNATW